MPKLLRKEGDFMMKKNKYCVAGVAVALILLAGIAGCGHSRAELLIAEEET